MLKLVVAISSGLLAQEQAVILIFQARNHELFKTDCCIVKDTDEKNRIIDGLRWIGMFSDEDIISCGNPLDTLCATLEKKMQYEEGERDFVMLQHKFEIENKDGSKETRTSTLVEYGDPKGTAMARLVGIPCAVAVLQVLDGTISEKGILAPMTPEICRPLLKTLTENYGVHIREKVIS